MKVLPKSALVSATMVANLCRTVDVLKAVTAEFRTGMGLKIGLGILRYTF